MQFSMQEEVIQHRLFSGCFNSAERCKWKFHKQITASSVYSVNSEISGTEIILIRIILYNNNTPGGNQSVSQQSVSAIFKQAFVLRYL